MIDKLLPRILNTSSDNRLKKKNEMNDAYNVVVTEDFNEFDNSGTSTGNEGVLKPVKGNIAIPGQDELFNEIGFDDAFVCGQIPDPRTGVVYFFVSSSQGTSGVYAYDANDYFGTGGNRWVLIHLMDLQSSRFIDGDIVHVSDGEGGFRPYLYFVNNVDEPFRLDVLLARERYVNEFQYQTGGGAFENDASLRSSQLDFIRACPKAPMHPITFVFERDDAQAASNFRKVPGFQFAYQCIYDTGEESAVSTYSDVAVPPEYIRQSVFSTQLQISNICRLFIPSAVEGAVNYTQNVEKIRILVREGNDGALFVVDEVDANPLGTVEYEFRNDRVLTGVTVEEENKLFDAVPRTAASCAVVEDRLFYGNYVEGFDEPTVEATVQVQYASKPNSFDDMEVTITPVIVPLQSDSQLQPTSLNQNDLNPAVRERVSGLCIDVNDVPDVIPADTFVFVNITIDPGRSYEMYSSEKSYHASRVVTSHPVDGELGQTLATKDRTFDPTDYPAGELNGEVFDGVLRVFGRNKGVGGSNLKWRTTETNSQAPGDLDAVIGSSPASALKFPGKKVNFNLEFRIVEQITNGKEVILQAICNGLDPDLDYGGVEYTQISNTASIDWDHGFLDPTEVPGYDDLPQEAKSNLTNLSLDINPAQAENTAILPKSGQDIDQARLIFPVMNDTNNRVSGLSGFEQSTNNGTFDFPEPPCGYSIVNSANVNFRLKFIRHALGFQPNRRVMALEVDSVNNIDVRTCIPIISPTDLKLKGWRVYSPEYLSTYLISDVNQTGTSEPDINVSYHFADFGLDDNAVDFLDAGLGPFNRKQTIGFLHSGDGTTIEDDQIYRTPKALREESPSYAFQNDQGIFVSTDDLRGFSLMDGAHALSVEEKTRTIESNVEGVILIPEIVVNDQATSNLPDVGCYGFDQIMLGYAALKNNNNVYAANLPLLVGEEILAADITPNTLLGVSKFNVHEIADNGNYLIKESDDDSLQTINTTYDAYLTESDTVGEYRSFKTHAFHDFGIVYYDERGRPGNVNQLPSVYVDGYSDEERGANKGRARVRIDIDSTPPPWAHNYQIVYSGNSTVRDFIQYSVGGAFRAINSSDEDDVPARNIYVSLNYLQGNDSVSYAKNFGARTADGTQNMYVYAPGDFLRVITYFENEDQIRYPNNLIFEILDVVNLGSNPDDNPLVASGEVPLHLQGQFLVLKDNNRVEGFRFNDVRNADNDEPQSSEHYWNNRCIVELISPRAVVDPENKVYYEIGEVYNVGRDDDGIYHQRPVVVISNGDVWWRRVPLNQPQFDDEEGYFLGLIQGEEGTTAPSFKQYYLESSTFNDTFPGTNVNNFGKRKFYSTESAEVRRFSSVTFGDKNNPSTRRLRYTSFNAYLAPFKDLPNEHGSIQRILNFSDSLFVVQNNKASAIPISRNVLSDALGNDSLITSNVVMGEQVFYAGSYGCDNNPESVLMIDNTVYFANKRKAEVYRFNPSNGIQVISRKGMDSFFKDAFEDVMEQNNADLPAIGNVGQITEENVRVVSGYDPLKDEYLLTLAVGYGRLAALQPGELINSQYAIVLPEPIPALGANDDYEELYPAGSGETGGGTGGGTGEVDLFDPYPINFQPWFTALDQINSGWPSIYSKQQQYNLASENLSYLTNGVSLPSDLLAITGGQSLYDLYTPPIQQLDVSGIISQDVANQIGSVDLSTFTAQGVTLSSPVATFDASSRTITVDFDYHLQVLGFGNFGAVDPEPVINGLWNLLQVSADGPSLQGTVATPQGYLTGNLPTTLGGYVWLNANQNLDTAYQVLSNTRNFGDEGVRQGWFTDLFGKVNQLTTNINTNYSDNPALVDWASELSTRTQAVNGVIGQQNYNATSTSVDQPVSGQNLVYPIGYDVDYLNIDPNGPASVTFNNYLTQLFDLVSELQAAHDSLNPNDLLDTAGVFAAMSERVSSLEAELDVLTDQIEEASSAPTIEGGAPLIPNVVSQNDNVLTRAVLAQGQGFGDRTLDSADVRSATLLANQLQFLSTNGVELDGDFVRQILRQFHRDTIQFVNAQSQDFIDPDTGQVIAGVSQAIAKQISSETPTVGFGLARLLTAPPADLVIDGVIGSSDIIDLLSLFGRIQGQDLSLPFTEEEYIAATDAIAVFFNEQ